MESLNDKLYRGLCETLFACMRQEKNSWLQGKSKSAKAAANLPLSASALRQVIISGVRTFKTVTVESILEELSIVLPVEGNGSLVKPLLEEIPKALRTLLEHQPHIERLSVDTWNSTVDLCIDCLTRLFSESEVAAELPSRSTGRSFSRASTPLATFDGTALTASRDSTARSRQLQEGLVHTAEDFVACLQHLVHAPNAPVNAKADRILSILVDFLQRRAGKGNSSPLAAINSVLARTSRHSVQLTKHTIKTLLPIIKSYWSNSLLRDELTITLIQTEAHIASILASKHEDNTAFDLENLVEAVYGEYRKRQETAVLQYLEDDHLSFRGLGRTNHGRHPLSTSAFSLGPGNHRCETLWVTVSLIARFSTMLDSRRRNQAQIRDDGDDDLPVKRLRTTQYYLQEYLRYVSEPRSNAKRAALQVLAFMVQDGPLDEDDLQQVLEKLTPYIADENSVHSTWAMIGLAAYVSLIHNLSLLISFTGLRFKEHPKVQSCCRIGFPLGKVHLG